MAEERRPDRTQSPACRWRTSAETLDVIEALERIEALLMRLEQRLQRVEEQGRRDAPVAPRS